MEVIDEMLSFGRGNILPILAETDLARWVALSRVPGLGCVSFKKLAGHFEDPTEALSASRATLTEIQGSDQQVIDGLGNFSAWDEVEKEIIKAEKVAVKIVPFTDPTYPARLRMIPDPPPVLFLFKGRDPQRGRKGCGRRWLQEHQ